VQLEECKLDLAENLFQGFDDGMVGNDLATWRRLNEFKSDI